MLNRSPYGLRKSAHQPLRQVDVVHVESGDLAQPQTAVDHQGDGGGVTAALIVAQRQVLEEQGNLFFSWHLQLLSTHPRQIDPAGDVLVEVTLAVEPREERANAAGVAADLLLWRLRPSAIRVTELRIFAIAVPAVFYMVYFAALAHTDGIGCPGGFGPDRSFSRERSGYSSRF